MDLRSTQRNIRCLKKIQAKVIIFAVGRSELFLLDGVRVNETTSNENPYVPPGMPPLDLSGRTTSYFEFWPMWLMYIPVVLQWLLLSVWHRSLTLPLIANPAVPLSGMVGVQKSAVFDAAGAVARDWILPWRIYSKTNAPIPEQAADVAALIDAAGFKFPVVGKPNIGCRGAGVKLLGDRAELEAYLSKFPVQGEIQFQRLSEWEAEAGVFYVRHPHAERGEITSITLKYAPFVIGDGFSTLAELIAADPRAGELQHLYGERHKANWELLIPAGEPYRLVFSASHSRGAVFRDAADLISEELLAALDQIFADIPGYHYGRLDIKFKDIESLRSGRDFHIIEINGASSESINIWDRNASLSQALRTLLQQYHTLFKLGSANRALGHEPPGLKALFSAWRFESQLVKQYPDND
jgi:hypothetical protein